ncbi:MAG: rRNA pseudouridine synthase [Treponema sp.]|nr:rRNA pseudouridine synthase [Treponema sp.]
MKISDESTLENPYEMRLDDFFTEHGFKTYRAVRKLLKNKNVTVNGVRVLEPGFRLNTKSDSLSVDGESVTVSSHIYLMMNKCQGVVCTTVLDGWNKSVYSMFPKDLLHPKNLPILHSVGRLDIDTEGLLVFTTDGKLSHRLTTPESHVKKTYLVYLRDPCDEAERKRYCDTFAEGNLFVKEEKRAPSFRTKPALLEWPSEEDEYCTLSGSDLTFCRLTLTEGKFHQVKRMFAAMGNEVIFLKRISMGNLFLDASLKPGEWRYLCEREILQMQER